jgi:uncharacterized membrane protein YphA (DoxX/SURF4 family)
MAIKMNQPIGPAAVGPLVARCAVGSYFMMAGLSKLQMLSAFVAQVKTFGVLPDNISSLYAVLLPYLEVFIGGCLVLGLWTTMVGFVASALLISFVFAFGFFPGASDIFNKDIVILGAVIGLLYTGPGAYSLDNVRKPSAPPAAR